MYLRFLSSYAILQLMLKIRLQRIGKKNKAYFRVVVTEHTTKPKGRYLELLGSYDPHANNISVNQERLSHWISKGAKMSPTVNNLLVERGLIKGQKVTVWKPKRPSADIASRVKPDSEAVPQEEQSASTG